MDRKRRLYQNRVKSGLCIKGCGRCSEPNHRLCSICLKQARDFAKRRYKERIISGTCTSCGCRPARIGINYCAGCSNKHKTAGSDRRRRLKIAVMSHYCGGKPSCQCCGEENLYFLTIDHINGNGSKHRRESVGAAHICGWLKKHRFPDGYQVLCMNCNFGRKLAGGVCPHKL